MMPVEELTVDDARWNTLFERTRGAIALCYQCGVCTASCPWGQVREGKSLPVRSLLRRAQLGVPDDHEDIWLCTACAQCETLCPRGVPVAAVFQNLRGMAWEERRVPKGLPSVLWSIYWNNNPWSQPPSYRSQWAKGLDVPRFDPNAHEILYYVGCTTAYDRRAQKVARALVKLFRAAGVRFGTLGEEEPCCGDAAKSLGYAPYFEEIVQNAAQVFAQNGVNRLVTTSPHCYGTFRNYAPRYQVRFEAEHYTQFIDRCLSEGRLRFSQEVPLRVAFHDPCFLGRRNGEYEAPRRILDAIPGLQRVEMARSRQDALCCGGGGGRMWMETSVGERFADLRVKDALATGAQVLVTACPFCIACFEESVKTVGNGDLRVMDVAELAAMAVE
ncbi:MAG: hypothetical protein KatS3mg022_1087 [Armatimonadota bacterium]|nr:MAG: hypothetical protein KatS3mg022_1087 [Armatimonadota bacterium]